MQASQAYRKAYKAARKRRGLCANCKQSAQAGGVLCNEHQAARRISQGAIQARRYRDPDRRAQAMLWSARMRAKRDGQGAG